MSGGQMTGGRLTTHVLDTATGRPAEGLPVDLFRLIEGERQHLGSFRTNRDGRCDAPLLAGEALAEGEYEILFGIAAWRPDGFYGDIPIRFRVADSAGHYHVPLILAPFGYSTYRGS